METNLVLLAEAKRLQTEFLTNGIYWSIEDCIDAVIEYNTKN